MFKQRAEKCKRDGDRLYAQAMEAKDRGDKEKHKELMAQAQYQYKQQKENEEKQEKEKVIEQQKETGKKIVKLVATFEVEVNSDIEDNEVWSKYVVELQKNFKSFVNLEIKK